MCLVFVPRLPSFVGCFSPHSPEKWAVSITCPPLIHDTKGKKVLIRNGKICDTTDTNGFSKNSLLTQIKLLQNNVVPQ